MHSTAKLRQPFLIAISMLLLASAALVPGAAAGDPAVASGDVNCDGSVNSVDAALILQFEAALKDSFACPDAADVDGDSAVNSIDARIVLELDAGIQAGLVRMYITVTEPEGLCGARAKPISCDIPTGNSFRLAIVLHSAPPEGYIAFQTHVFLDRLRYDPTALGAHEIVWPDVRLPVRDDDVPGYVAHGGLSSVTPPFRISSYQGALVELNMACPPASSTHDVSLLAYDLPSNALGSSISVLANPFETIPPVTIGRLDLDPFGNGLSGPVLIAHTLEINCV